MLRKRIIGILIVVVVIAAAVGGYLYFRTKTAAAVITDSAPLQTATVRKGDLTISASGVGVIVANEGINDSTLLNNLLTAHQSYLEAQSNYDTVVAQIPVDLATAEVNLATAQTTLATNLKTRDGMNYIRCTDETIDELKETYDNTYARYVRRPSASGLVSVQTALNNLNWCMSRYPDNEIAQADADVAIAKANITTYEATVKRLSMETDPTELILARTKLALAKSNFEAVLPIALLEPEDKIISETLTQIREGVNIIPDLGTPLLVVYMDESDLGSVMVGNTVEVVFDAIPDSTFKGKVVFVYPKLVAVNSVNVVEAYVQLDPESFNKPVQLPIGMNATVDVINDSAVDVLLIPVEALREIDTGEYSVFVMENNVLTMRTVEVGLMDLNYAEIKSGLKVGDVVSTGIVETTK